MGFENDLVETDQLAPAINVHAAAVVVALVRQSAGNLNHIQVVDVEELGGLCCGSALNNKAMGISRNSCRQAERRTYGVALSGWKTGRGGGEEGNNRKICSAWSAFFAHVCSH